jgi:toxin CptA
MRSTARAHGRYYHVLRVTLNPSVYLSIAFTLSHAAAAVIVLRLAVPFWIELGLLAALATSLVLALRYHALLKSRDAVTAIDIGEQDATVYSRDVRYEHACVLGTTYVSALLTVLNLRVPGRMRPRHVILVPDNVDAETFRQLRVRLRWSRRPLVRGRGS